MNQFDVLSAIVGYSSELPCWSSLLASFDGPLEVGGGGRIQKKTNYLYGGVEGDRSRSSVPLRLIEPLCQAVSQRLSVPACSVKTGIECQRRYQAIGRGRPS